MLQLTEAYSGKEGVVAFRGRVVEDADAFAQYSRETVLPRLEQDPGFREEISAIATTGMSSEFVERLLSASSTPEPWEVGEAFVECIMRDEGRFVWPWNGRADRKTPRASLPGADLVGFRRDGAEATLVFGEVKTSSDANTPPSVMYGAKGMIWQLEASATELDVQHCLLKWLRLRCTSSELRALFQSALVRFVKSEGRGIVLIGALVRDTPPDRRDLENRAQALAKALDTPSVAELSAYYLPHPVSEWLSRCEAGDG